MRDGVLRLPSTRAWDVVSPWADGPSAEMVAFARSGGRCRSGAADSSAGGTDVIVSIKNSLADSTLTVHGLVSRPVPRRRRRHGDRRARGDARGEVSTRRAGGLLLLGHHDGRPFRSRVREDAQLRGPSSSIRRVQPADTSACWCSARWRTHHGREQPAIAATASCHQRSLVAAHIAGELSGR